MCSTIPRSSCTEKTGLGALLALLVGLGCATPTYPRVTMMRADSSWEALPLGSIAPPLKLARASGPAWSLREQLPRGPVLVAFFRGGW